MVKKTLSSLLLTLMFTLILVSCAENKNSFGPDSLEPETQLPSAEHSTFYDARLPDTVELSGAHFILLSDNEYIFDGVSYPLSSGYVHLDESGTYVLRGSLSNGRIIIKAEGGAVTLVLAGAYISSSENSPITVDAASSLRVHLYSDTTNSLSDNYSFSSEDTHSGISCSCDLTFTGSGALSVSSKTGYGILCSGSLTIYDCELTIVSGSHGIRAKGNTALHSAVINIGATRDSINIGSKNSEAGLSVSSSKLELVSSEDGIQTSGDISLTDCECTVSCCPGSSDGGCGLKSDGTITVTNALLIIQSDDDCMHSKSSVCIKGLDVSLDTSEKAICSEDAVTIESGKLTIIRSKEGIEAFCVYINGAKSYIYADDDGINARSDNGDTSQGQKHPTNDDCTIEINGGNTFICAGGDGLDSNGKIIMTGGALTAFSYSEKHGALDYDTSFTLLGGTLFAGSSCSKPYVPSSSDVPVFELKLLTPIPAQYFLQMTTSNGSETIRTPIDINHIVYSSPLLSNAESCTFEVGSEFSGTVSDGLCGYGSITDPIELGQYHIANKLITTTINN